MSGSRRGKKDTGKHPADEDSALWEFVAASVRPVRGKHRVTDVETPEVTPRLTRKDRPAHPPSNQPTSPRVAAPGHKPIPPATIQPRSSPAPNTVMLERKRARRIARGTEEIEARLDLHGMTQAAAHAELSGFIKRCAASGLRLVLVITGKGGTGSRHDDDHVVPRQRGVLKRNVPRWLAEPDLSPLVVSHWSAHVRHGGDGALYVQLRVKR